MKPANTPNNGATILLVEDNEDLRENATLVLSLEGYNVFSARDGQDAMDLLNSGQCQPDLIVSDIAMPRMDGYGFFNAVHAIPELRVVPFIFLTARGSARDIRFGKQLGADDYLPKPFNADDFLVAVKNKLKRSAEMREHAEGELDDARRKMVQLLSHELRTPLTYVTGGFSLLAEGLEHQTLPDDMQLSMGLIHNGTQRLNRLAEQMVLFAELISGHAKLQLQEAGAPTDVEALAKDVINVTSREFSARAITFSLNSQFQQPVEVFTVSQLLTNALYEILRNAATYCAEGSSVTIDLRADGRDAWIVVTDRGWGIKPDDLADIWNVMVQSQRDRYEQQGAGMGLPLVKQIALLHGGEVTLESEAGVGTKVGIRLPVYQRADGR